MGFQFHDTNSTFFLFMLFTCSITGALARKLTYSWRLEQPVISWAINDCVMACIWITVHRVIYKFSKCNTGLICFWMIWTCIYTPVLKICIINSRFSIIILNIIENWIAQSNKPKVCNRSQWPVDDEIEDFSSASNMIWTTTYVVHWRYRCPIISEIFIIVMVH